MLAKNIELLSEGINMPQIPKAFMENSLISQVLRLTINEFNYEEKMIIFLYCFVKLPINEIAALTKLTPFRVVSTLVLYSERLEFKLDVFKKAVPYDTTNLISVGEMFDLENMEAALPCPEGSGSGLCPL